MNGYVQQSTKEDGPPNTVFMSPGTRTFVQMLGLQGTEFSNGSFFFHVALFKVKPDVRVTLWLWTKHDAAPLYEVNTWVDGHCTTSTAAPELLPFDKACYRARDIFRSREAAARLTGELQP